MKVTIRDEQVLRAIRPEELIAYLRSSGFREHGMLGGTAGLWRRRHDDDDVEILAPLDPTLGDFASRMLDALKTLEVVERRSQIDILRDIATSMADVVRIPATRADLRDGSLSIQEGLLFYQSARDLLLAAACAALEPRSHYPSRRPGPAVQYLERARFGQTERSSYVLTVLSPVPPRLSMIEGAEGAEELEEPYERKVTTTLMTAVQVAGAAAARANATGALDHFRQAAQAGVSANLCEALVGLSQLCDPARDLEISVTWAAARPGPREVPNRVRVPAGAVPVFSEAARIFRAQEPVPEFELRGVVLRLDRPEAATEGTVTILGLVEGHPRKVELRLTELEYGLAVRAHADRLPVACVGDLRHRGHTFTLEHPRQFVVESPTD